MPVCAVCFLASKTTFYMCTSTLSIAISTKRLYFAEILEVFSFSLIRKFHIFATRWALAQRRLHLKGWSSDDVFWEFCICWYLLSKSWVAGNSIQLFTDCNPCWAKLKGLVLIVFAQDHTDIRCTKDEKGCIFTIVLFGSFESWSVFDLSVSNLWKCSLSILCALTWYGGITILLKWWSENFIA